MEEGPTQLPVLDEKGATGVEAGTATVERLQLDTESAAEMAAAVAYPPANYQHLTPEEFARCSPRDLVRYSAQAQAARDWVAVIRFQETLVKVQPNNARGHLFLSLALERTGQYADALTVWERAISIPGYRPDPRDAYRCERLRARMYDQASTPGARPVRHDLPSSHMQVTPEMFKLCADHDLLRYSLQAQQDERWDRVEMFQWELVKRHPRNIMAHIVLTRAFVKQGKMEDAAALMPTIEELRTPQDDIRVTRAVATLKRILARRPTAENFAATSPAPSLASPAPSLSAGPATDSVPTPRKLSNIDTSRFDNFLASIQREAENWPQIQGHGEGWRKIPEDENDFFTEAFVEFRKQLERAIPKGPNRALWGKFDDIEMQFQRGIVNVNALATLMDRAENAASGAKVDFGRLEPIRIKTRSAGPKLL
ncbi:hypothetical protein HYW83_02880 [Candidatus Peregrinibacteria bacterium]|nr:hypothetical protein [Candidatus Peregrinibacteria bacterium]